MSLETSEAGAYLVRVLPATRHLGFGGTQVPVFCFCDGSAVALVIMRQEPIAGALEVLFLCWV